MLSGHLCTIDQILRYLGVQVADLGFNQLLVIFELLPEFRELFFELLVLELALAELHQLLRHAPFDALPIFYHQLDILLDLVFSLFDSAELPSKLPALFLCSSGFGTGLVKFNL